MIPYLTLPSIDLGPLRIHPYGMFVGLGLIVCAWITFVRAREAEIPDSVINRALAAAGVSALLGAHLFHVLSRMPDEPGTAILRFWDGYSSVGGMIGGAGGLWVYARLSGRRWLTLAEVLLQGMVGGWVLGRLGCAFAHDHPGIPSRFFLAIAYPEGSRHDLGFYEFLFSAAVMIPAMFMLRRARTQPGSGRFLAAAALLYTPFRFGIEFLRDSSTTPSWAGLYPGQWAALAIAGLGIAALSIPVIEKRGPDRTHPSPNVRLDRKRR